MQREAKVRVIRTWEQPIYTKFSGEAAPRVTTERREKVIFKGSRAAFEIWKKVHAFEGCTVDMAFISKEKVPEKAHLRRWETTPVRVGEDQA